MTKTREAGTSLCQSSRLHTLRMEGGCPKHLSDSQKTYAALPWLKTDWSRGEGQDEVEKFVTFCMGNFTQMEPRVSLS